MTNPDKEIEEFWLHFKQSMINFYDSKNYLKRPISEWSNTLNFYQSKKNYIEIEKKILNYISLYSIDLMRISDNYHMNILITNIKRWKRVLNNYTKLIDNNRYYNIIFLLIDIFKSIMYDDNEKQRELIFSQIELIILYEDFTQLIKYAIENKKPSIIKKIYNFKIIFFIFKDYTI